MAAHEGKDSRPVLMPLRKDNTLDDLRFSPARASLPLLPRFLGTTPKSHPPFVTAWLGTSLPTNEGDFTSYLTDAGA